MEGLTKLVSKHFQQTRQEEKPHRVLKRLVPCFTDEIRCMMQISGDYYGTLDASALLMEKIIRDQMNKLLIRATEVNFSVDCRVLTHEHFLMLLRRNRETLRRLLFYLHAKDVNEQIEKKKYAIAGEIMDCPKRGKRIKACFTFFNSMGDQLACLMDKTVPDAVTVKRNKRKYLLTSTMSDEEYKAFCKKSETTFCPKNSSTEFKKWLLADKVIHSSLTDFSLEIINFLVRETIFQIMDMCFSFRKEEVEHSNEPRQCLEPIYPENIRDALRHFSLIFMKDGDQSEFKTFKSEIGVICMGNC